MPCLKMQNLDCHLVISFSRSWNWELVELNSWSRDTILCRPKYVHTQGTGTMILHLQYSQRNGLILCPSFCLFWTVIRKAKAFFCTFPLCEGIARGGHLVVVARCNVKGISENGTPFPRPFHKRTGHVCYIGLDPMVQTHDRVQN